MSLQSFQRAMCDLIASPELCLRLGADEDEVLGAYDLTPRERRRLAGVARQPGMSVNCTLYRVNRVTPLYTLLPRTCLLLGDDLSRRLDEYWASHGSDLQFGPEIDRFAGFLRERIASGELPDPMLAEVLEFEVALKELRYASGDEPRVREVRFVHDPVAVLAALGEGRRADDCARGDYRLRIDATGPRLELSLA